MNIVEFLMKSSTSLKFYVLVSFAPLLCIFFFYSYNQKLRQLHDENTQIKTELGNFKNIIASVVDVPTEVVFCNQTITFDDPYTRERLQRELVNLYFYKNQLELYKRRAKYFFPIIEYYLDFYDLPSDLKYLAVHESALNAKARSHANAVGLWQFMSYTAKQFDLNITYYVDDRRHPIKSSKAACQYLKQLYKKFQDWPLAIASYNGGETRIAKSMKQQGATSFYDLSLPEETERYFFKIVATSIILKEYEKEIKDESQQFHLEPVEIVVEQDILEIKEISQEFNIPYRTFFNFNPQFRRHVIPYGRHTLMIPKGHVVRVQKEKEKNYFVFNNSKKP